MPANHSVGTYHRVMTVPPAVPVTTQRLKFRAPPVVEITTGTVC